MHLPLQHANEAGTKGRIKVGAVAPNHGVQLAPQSFWLLAPVWGEPLEKGC